MDRNQRIVIAGAGMGGLATALTLAKKGFTQIDVYETASDLGFVGAGIQLAPNMARILDRLGVWADIEKEAVVVSETSIRQGDENKELASVQLGYIREKYGYPHMVGHRSSLAGSLYKGCQKEPSIKFHFSTAVEGIESFFPKPSIVMKPRNGQPYIVKADILLSAEGIKSITRTAILKEINAPDAKVIDTEQAAYRIMLRRDEMAHDPELLNLIDRDIVTRWIGEKRHIIAYPVSNKTIYNISTAQPDKNFAAAPSATYTTKGSKSAMLSTFDSFCPMIKKMLNLVPDGEVCEWRLRVHSPLPTWVHGSCALVGDACHPTLPHLAQGAAQAIEDAAVLGVVLDSCPDSSPKSINKSLRVYQDLRKDRAETLVELAAANGRELQLGTGAAKEERDKKFAALKDKQGAVPDKWADADVQKMIYGHDCIREAEEKYQELFAKL